VTGIRYSAAVGLDSERTGSQRLYVVAEARGDSLDAEASGRLTGEIVRRIHHERGHRPARVLLVQPGTIPKTSSGKIQHSRLIEMIQAGELKDRVLHPTD
jgi:acyl-coenzyme A synthetase/AMP-(fatty) acid ligase